MFVTVMADASHCDQTEAAGYGYWIVSDRGRRPGGGIIEMECGNSTVAEMCAICLALHEGVQLKLIEPHDVLLIQTDSVGAIDRFEGRVKLDFAEKAMVPFEFFNKFKEQHNVTVIFKHVKGHTRSRESRFAANNHCDRRAKAAMRQARDQKRKQK